MLKRVFVLRIGNYRPDLCKFTIPTIRAYAEKVGAEYVEITERKYPELPITFEKLQVLHLGAFSDWNILIDADMMVRPDTPDVTQYLSPAAVASAFAFDANHMFSHNRFFERDGRNVGIVGNFVVTTKLTHEVWNWRELYSSDLFDLDDLAEELDSRTKRKFIIDEYVLSHNLAKFGLRHTGVLPSPQLEEMLVHVGSEERTASQRCYDAVAAGHLYNDWKLKFPGVLP